MKIETERINKYVEYFFKDHMQPHFQNEEQLLFAPINDDKVQKALRDHSEIRELVAQILQSPIGDSATKLSTLADTVEAHVRYEERELFPHLEKVFTDEQLQVIGEAISKEELVPDNYKDEFWINKNK